MAVRYQFIVAPILVAIGAIICIISLATPYWASQTVEGVSTYGGLWRVCFSVEHVTSCSSFKSISWLNATRAMVIISVALSFLTLALGITAVIKGNAPFSIAAAVSAFV